MTAMRAPTGRDRGDLAGHVAGPLDPEAQELVRVVRRGRPLKRINVFESREMVFALALRDARRDAGMTQTDLADRTGKSRDHIGRLERGNGLPDRSFMLSLRGVLPGWKELQAAYEDARDRGGTTMPLPARGPAILDVVGIGMCNVDLIAGTSALSRRAGEPIVEYGSRFEWGAEHVVDATTFNRVLDYHGEGVFDATLGGSSFNTIRTLAEMNVGLSLGFVSVMGVDGPHPATHDEHLKQLNVDVAFLEPIHAVSGRCVSCVEDGERILFTSLGGNVGLGRFLERRFHDLVDYLSRARLIHVSSLPDAHTERVALELLARVKAASPLGILCIDPGHIWLSERRRAVDGMFRLADYILLNYREFKLLGDAEPGQMDEEIAARALRRCGPGTSIVVVDRYNRIRMFRGEGEALETVTWDAGSAPIDRIEDATGAGDVFDAGFVAALASSRLHCDAGAMLGATLAREKLAFVGGADKAATARVTAATLARMRQSLDAAPCAPER